MTAPPINAHTQYITGGLSGTNTNFAWILVYFYNHAYSPRKCEEAA